MLADLSWQLGVGAVLGWVALPLLIRFARRSQQASPAAYYRALVTALLVAAALGFAPALRGALGSVELAPWGRSWAEVPSITLVADWVGPLVGARREPWPSMPLARVLSALGLVWLGSVVLGIAQSAAKRWRFARRHRFAQAAPARVMELAARASAQLGVAVPAIRVSDEVASAFTFGFIAPVVMLGPSLLRANDEELDFVLRHELTHVARGDARAALGIELAGRCFGLHPSLAPLEREIRFAREAAVDEAVAGARSLEYARFLLGLAERLEARSTRQAPQLSMADTALERRIEMLLSKREKARRGRFGAAGLALAGLALGALVFVAPSSFGQGADAGTESRAKVTGNLSVAQIEQVVFGNPQPVLECYGRLQAPRANLPVRLVFEIAEDGRVSSSRVEVASHPELEPCFEPLLRAMVFPAPSSGTVQVDMPTLLTPPLDERNARAEADEGVSRRLPAQLIREVVGRHFERFRACYDSTVEPRSSARVTLKFRIGRDGTVVDGQVDSQELPALGACLDPVMRSMRFPAPEDGIVSVEYPLAFGPGQPGNTPPER